MAARTRRWVSEVAGIPSLAKMCLMCFSAALRVIQKVFAMPAFHCPLGHEREHLAFSWRERVEGSVRCLVASSSTTSLGRGRCRLH